MDVQELSDLLTSSTAHLKELHAQLGHPPDHLQGALTALHDALKQAVDGQVSNVESEVKEARAKVETLESECQELRLALGEAKPNRASTGKRSSENRNGGTEELPLLPRISALQSEWQRLKNLHGTRMAQVNKIRDQLEAYRPLLGSFVASLPALEAESPASSKFESVPVSYINTLNASLASCANEVQSRRKELDANVQAILQLWSELCYPPDVQPQANGSASFDSLVLRHLRLQPMWAEVEMVDEEGNPIEAADGFETEYEFRGEFAPVETLDGDEGESAPSSGGASVPDSTPTRSSGSHATLGPAPRLIAAHELAPLKENLNLVKAKRQHLEDEKTRREEQIQALYDELVELWMKFDVGEEEMDAFVQSNCGSTASVIEAYESELLKMRELKSQHMALFISKVRQSIADLWDEIRMSPEERTQDFEQFFYDLDDGSGQIDAGVEPSDELLRLHEQHVEVLRREAELKRVPLALVKRYRDLLDEGKALEESAKDQTRLMGRGARGDPGRLLREEKTRKRLKMLKPKLEDELQRAIPAWEAETGKVFTVDGSRFIDELVASIGEAASKKRPRVASNAARPVLGASDAQNRQPAVAATPQTGNKRQRLNSNMTGSTVKGGASSSRLLSNSVSQSGSVYGQTPSTMQKPSSSRRPPAMAPTPTPLSMRPQSKAVKTASPTKGSSSSFGFTAPANRQANGNSNSSMGFKAPASFRPRPSSSIMGGGLGQAQVPRNTSHNSVSSIDTNATTVVHAFPQLSPSRRPKTTIDEGSSTAKRFKKRGPSLALQPSLQSSSASAFARPSISGAGATIRTISSSSSGSSLSTATATKSNGPSPNWAVLEDGEEGMDEDLLQGDAIEAYGLDADDLPSMRGESNFLVA